MAVAVTLMAWAFASAPAARTSISRAAAAPRACVVAKGKFGYRRFDVSMWYPDTDLKSNNDWVSAYAPHAAKLELLEQELEQCEFLLEDAIAHEHYDDADGLRERIDRLWSTHPVWPVEAELSEAIASSDFERAKAIHSRLEDIRWNLGLPRYLIGQVVRNKQADFNVVIVSVELNFNGDAAWLQRCADHNALRVDKGLSQPFYVCLVDQRDDPVTPRELYLWEQNIYSKNTRPAVYLPEEALEVVHDLPYGFEHSMMGFLFDEPDPSYAPSGQQVGLGMRFKPTINLRLWQRNQLRRLRSHSAAAM